jgi:DNA-binding MarR family transcriptional regulator
MESTKKIKEMTRKTQVDSLKKLKPTIGAKQQSVYNVIRYLRPATNRNIAKHLGWDVNRVTGRVTELVSKGMVMAYGTHYDNETKRTVTLWKAL